MIIIVDNTYLDFDKVNSILISPKPEETKSAAVWWNPNTWGTTEVVKDATYTLKMEYSRAGALWTYTSENKDSAYLLAKFKKIVSQLKTQVDIQNQEMLDRLFEEAVSNGGSK
jgi:hypothetical protein